MENIAASVGGLVCQMATGFMGTGQAVCYNTASSATIGYSVLLGLGLVLLFRRIFSRVG